MTLEARCNPKKGAQTPDFAPVFAPEHLPHNAPPPVNGTAVGDPQPLSSTLRQGVLPHCARNATLSAAPLCLLAAACARSRCLRVTNLSAAARGVGVAPDQPSVSSHRCSSATARRTNGGHRQRLALLWLVFGAPERGSLPSQQQPFDGGARPAAAHTTGEPGHSNADHRTGTVRRLRLAPVLTPDFGIVDDVAAVCEVTWELVASCSDCDTTALVLELPDQDVNAWAREHWLTAHQSAERVSAVREVR